MAEAYEQPSDLCNKKLKQLSLSCFPGDVKALKLSNFINIAYTLSERWHVDTCDAGATSTKARYMCCKVGAKSMGAVHLFPSVKEAKKMKGKNLKKVIRYFLLVLEKLEEKYSDFYQRRTWPKASVKAQGPVSAPTPVVTVELPECAFGPDAIPGQSSGGMKNSPVNQDSASPASSVGESAPAPEVAPSPVQAATQDMSEMTIADSKQPEPKPKQKPTSVVLSWLDVNNSVAKFPKVLNKLKQLVVRHVLQDKAEIVPNSFNFNVAVAVDVDIVNDRLSRLMKMVLEQMHDELDTGLQLALHKTASRSRLAIC